MDWGRALFLSCKYLQPSTLIPIFSPLKMRERGIIDGIKAKESAVFLYTFPTTYIRFDIV